MGGAGPKARSFRGFTLVELLAVVVILAVTTAVVTVRLDGFTARGRLNSAARQIGAIYRLARAQALASGRPALLEYVLNSNRIRLLRPALDGERVRWRGGDGFSLGERVVIREVVKPFSGRQHAEPASRDSALCFINTGGLGPDHVVVLSTGNTHRATVTVHGLTGQESLAFTVQGGATE